MLTKSGMSVEESWEYSDELERWDIFAEFHPAQATAQGYSAVRVYRYPENDEIRYYPWNQGEEAIGKTVPQAIIDEILPVLPPKPPIPEDYKGQMIGEKLQA